MRIRKFRLTDAQVQELTGAYRQCTDGSTRTRNQAVRLYGTGYPVEEIQKITGCSPPASWNGVAPTRNTGRRRGGNSAKLTEEQRIEIETRLHAYTPHDLFGTHPNSRWAILDRG